VREQEILEKDAAQRLLDAAGQVENNTFAEGEGFVGISEVEMRLTEAAASASNRHDLI